MSLPPPPPPQYVIRKATEADCEAIHHLIMELAIFEKSPDQVTNTVQGLKEHGFGETSYFQCLVAETNVTTAIDDTSSSSASSAAAAALCNGDHHIEKTVIGFALYFFGYSTWDGKLAYLEDLYVTTDHRGAGIGTALIRRVAKLAADVGCVRMQWTVLGWNKVARRLYDKIGAEDYTETADWHLMTMRKETFIHFAQQDTNSNGNILCI